MSIYPKSVRCIHYLLPFLIAKLQAEGNWWKDNADLLERRLKRRGLEATLKEEEEKIGQLHNYVREQEFNYIEMQRQLANISPRATQQGWKEELEKNVAEHFEWITKSVQKNT